MPQRHSRIPKEKVDEAYAIGLRFASRVLLIWRRQSSTKRTDIDMVAQARREALELIDRMVRLAGPRKAKGLFL